MSEKLSRDELLDEAIVKAKASENWQLVEWLRAARGSDDACRWFTAKINDLKTENEQLRKERDHWRVEQVHAYGNWEDANKYAAELERQNAELRELAQNMYACISHAIEQIEQIERVERDKLGCGMSCVVNGESCGLFVLADRMRKLGMEAE